MQSSSIPKKHWLLLSNAQSLFYTLDELRALTEATKPTIMCITETWFNPEIDDDLIQIQGYLSFRCDRSEFSSDKKRGGGVIVYVMKNCNPFYSKTPLDIQPPKDIESVVVGFSDDGLSFLLCAYIPPNLSSEMFFAIKDYVIATFDFILASYPDAKIYLSGDLNQYDFSFLPQSFDLVNIVNFPTLGNNNLDKFFCYNHVADTFSAFSAPPLGFAMHLHKTVFISKHSSTCKVEDACYKVYDLRKSNVQAFCNKISHVDWSSIYSFSSLPDAVDFFYDNFTRAMSVIPLTFVKLSSKTKPWITPVLLDLINKRWRAFRERKFDLYNHYKVKVKQEITKSKRIWSRRMCTSVKGIWSVVREIRNKHVCTSSGQIAALFPNVLEAVENLNVMFSSSFVDTSTTLSLDCGSAPKICDHFTVLRMLHQLRTDKASGSDNVPPILLKMAARDICAPICHIFNLSMSSACVPVIWKIADICPIPKALPVTKEKLRPISLLPVLAKLLEKAVLNFYRESLLKCYDKDQFSYRPLSSTVCGLITIQDNVLKFLDDPNVAGARIITFDMSRAFDCVPHNYLLNRLCEFKFPFSENFVNWISSYLSNRKQRVKLFQTVSSLTDVTSGVPQGSVLGPYLFALYMSTYNSFCADTKVVKYADDVTIIIPVYKNCFDDLSYECSEIQHFKFWCCENGMNINDSKTKCMNLCFRLQALPLVPGLQNVSVLKILGLVFNDKLTWNEHFDYICKRISKRLYVLRVLRSLFSHDELVDVFCSLIRSLMEYACPVFLNPGSGLDKKFIALCKRAYRVIHRSNEYDCSNCNLLNIVSRRKDLTLRLFTHALKNDNHSLHSLLPNQSYRSRRLLLPHVRCSRRLNGFVIAASILYNEQF